MTTLDLKGSSRISCLVAGLCWGVLYIQEICWGRVASRIWQRLKNIGLATGLGGLFATRFATKSGGLATNPPCDKPIEDYGPRQGFVTEGRRQRYVTEGGGGDRDKPLFRVTAILF